MSSLICLLANEVGSIVIWQGAAVVNIKSNEVSLSQEQKPPSRFIGCDPNRVKPPGIGPIVSSAMSPRSGPVTASLRVATLPHG